MLVDTPGGPGGRSGAVRDVSGDMGGLGADPTRRGPAEGCETDPMPVLDPNPQNGQKKMLLVFGTFLAITVIIAVIATIASP